VIGPVGFLVAVPALNPPVAGAAPKTNGASVGPAPPDGGTKLKVVGMAGAVGVDVDDAGCWVFSDGMLNWKGVVLATAVENGIDAGVPNENLGAGVLPNALPFEDPNVKVLVAVAAGALLLVLESIIISDSIMLIEVSGTG